MENTEALKNPKTSFLSRPLLIITMYSAMTFIGLLNGVRSVCIPLIKADFGVGYDMQGIMLACANIAGIITAILSGMVLEKLGSKRASMIYFILLIVSLWGMFWSPTFFIFVIFYCFNFASAIYYENCKNDVALRCFWKNFATHVSMLSFCVGMGSIAGPKLASFLIANVGFSFRQVFLCIAIIPLVLLMLVMISKFNLDLPTRQKDAEKDIEPEAEKAISTLAALRMPIIWLIGFGLAMVGNVDKGMEEWSLLYFQDMFGTNPVTTGATFMTLYFVCMSVGRFVNGFLMERFGYFRYYKAAIITCLVIMGTGFLIGEIGIWVLAISGGFVAMFWPTHVAIMLKSFGRSATSIAGAAMAISSAIRAVSQWGMGLLNKYIGPAWGFRCMFLFTVILFFIVIFTQKALKKQEA